MGFTSVHQTYMGTLERGEANVSLGNLHKISKALGVTLAELFRTVEKRAATSRKVKRHCGLHRTFVGNIEPGLKNTTILTDDDLPSAGDQRGGIAAGAGEEGRRRAEK